MKSNFTIEEISKEQDEAVCQIIKKVGAEHGAVGEGFGPSDPEVLCMSEYYGNKKSIYLVAVKDGHILGGSGIAEFNNSNSICELKKLFLLKEGRGLGIGKKLTEKCLAFAISEGYKQCYLDTLSGMKSAIALYEKFGFHHLEQPLIGTIHNGCDVWMLKKF